MPGAMVTRSIGVRVDRSAGQAPAHTKPPKAPKISVVFAFSIGTWLYPKRSLANVDHNPAWQAGTARRKSIRYPFGRVALHHAKFIDFSPCDGGKVTLDPIPAELLACNFWLLTATNDHPADSAAWYQPDGASCRLSQRCSSGQQPIIGAHAVILKQQPPCRPKPSTPTAQSPTTCCLPLPECEGISDWQLKVIRYFADKYHPTIGFSPAEAVLCQPGDRAGRPGKCPRFDPGWSDHRWLCG